MPYVFECDICHKQGPNHIGTLTTVLSYWDEKVAPVELKQMVTYCIDCHSKVVQALTDFSKQLNVEPGKHTWEKQHGNR